MTCDLETCPYYEFEKRDDRSIDRHICWAEPVPVIRSTGPDVPRACHHPGLQADLNDSLLAIARSIDSLADRFEMR